MPFSYYSRLPAREQAIYRASDRIATISLPRPNALWPLAQSLRSALSEDDRHTVALAAQSLSRALLEQLGAPPLTLKVLALRPSRGWGELHGLYTADENKPAEIRLWMRTARQGRVVAFRTFLRTLLHELCHHLDYQTLKLGDSFHTEGFFRRESSLFRQIVPDASPPRAAIPTQALPPSRAAGSEPRPPLRPRDRPPQRGATQATSARQGRIRFEPDEPG